MPLLHKHILSIALAGVILLASVGLASVALAGGGGIGTGGGDGDGGGGREYVFPLPAPHQYGDGFGAGRNHQGQDVFANCGSKLIANHTARVQQVATDGSAGNYIVLDAEGSGTDYAYMHMKNKAIPREGSKVRKGEKIGEVGETGNAVGCHVHFEMRKAPGFWSGPASPNVTDALKKWDKYS